MPPRLRLLPLPVLRRPPVVRLLPPLPLKTPRLRPLLHPPSCLLVLQCIGRGLRLHAGKEDCRVIDMTDRHHDIARVASLADVVGPSERGSREGQPPPPPPLLAESTGALRRAALHGVSCRQGCRLQASLPACQPAACLPLPPAPLPRTVNLAAAVQRGRLDLLQRQYCWTRFPGTNHYVFSLFTPDKTAGWQGGGGSAAARGPRVSWKIWLVACEPLQQQQPQGAGGASGGGKSSSSAGDGLRYLCCIMRQEGKDAFDWELVGSEGGGGRRGSRQQAQSPAPVQARAPAPCLWAVVAGHCGWPSPVCLPACLLCKALRAP